MTVEIPGDIRLHQCPYPEWTMNRLTTPTRPAATRVPSGSQDRCLTGANTDGGQAPLPNPLDTVAPDIREAIRRVLIDQETTYQSKPTQREFASIWAHSSRVACIAHHISRSEAWDPEPALLAGLLHDCGKLAHGRYHETDTPEEERAVRIARNILVGSEYERWLPAVADAILSTFLGGEATSDVGRAVYDADCLDKLGNTGVVQFFVKQALRQRFLNHALLLRASIELTYAHHAPETLTTVTGRSLARARGVRTRRFYDDLLKEWSETGLGAFTIVEEEIAGISCRLVVPETCSCGHPLAADADIMDSLKCRTAVVTYRCPGCGFESDYSFCLPGIKGLPPKR